VAVGLVCLLPPLSSAGARVRECWHVLASGGGPIKKVNTMTMCAATRSGCSHPHILTKERRKRSTTLQSIVEINYQEIVMNKDQVKGRVKEAEGKVKEVTG
jgi:hypothetical protein